jgi:phosphoadenosine phosphosulfate reductase
MIMSSVASADYFDISDKELRAMSDDFEAQPPEAILRWAFNEFGSDVALATGFGAEGSVLIHMLARINKAARIFYLDTDLLFPETYALRDQLERRYGIRFEQRATRLSLSAQAAKFGDRLWARDPDRCCHLRKVEPLREILKGLRAWISAIRRDQTLDRAHAGIVERDAKFDLIKINPLATWSSRDIWDYIKQYDVPYNPLYDQGYGSIGCAPCTTLVQIGEEQRAGRWRGIAKTECGLHK